MRSGRGCLRAPRGNWLNGFLAGITLAMALLPEEFPVVLTIFLALGAWRISQKRVLTRRCRRSRPWERPRCSAWTRPGRSPRTACRSAPLRARRFYAVDRHCGTPSPRSSTRSGVQHPGQPKDPFDPMEKASKSSATITYPTPSISTMTGHCPGVSALPGAARAVACLAVPRPASIVIATKGAPEAIADLCLAAARRRTRSQARRRDERPGRPAHPRRGQGLLSRRTLPGEQHAFTFEFLGLVGLPIRCGRAWPRRSRSVTPPASGW